MHGHWLTGGMMGGRQHIAVVYTSTSVIVGIGQYHDVLIRNARQEIMQLLQMKGGEITLAIKGIKMAGCGCSLPQALMRYAHPTVFGRSIHGNEIKSVCHGMKRLMGKQGLDGLLAIPAEYVHLIGLIALCHKSYVYLAPAVSACAQILPSAHLPYRTYENVSRIHTVLHAAAHLAVGIKERDGDVYRCLGHGNEEYVLKGFLHPSGLLGDLPFLKQGAERVSVQDHSHGIGHGYLPVALEEQTVQMNPPPIPSFRLSHLVQIDLLASVVTAEDIVEAECLVPETIIKVLCQTATCHPHQESSERKGNSSYTHTVILLCRYL